MNLQYIEEYGVLFRIEKENGIKTKRSLRSVRLEMLSLAEMLKQN